MPDPALPALETLPPPLRDAVRRTLQEVMPGLPEAVAGQPDWRAALPRVLAGSDFVAGLLRRDPGYLGDLVDTGALFAPCDTAALRQRLEQLFATVDDETELMRTLRRERNRAMLLITFRDLAGWASLDEVMAALTGCADALLDTTLAYAAGVLARRYGEPLGEESGTPQRLVALGMGKLGGGELNFSSDVDLIFCFPENGHTDSERGISNAEFFARQVKLFIKLVATQTADGFVYRVDTRLRPNGDSGPLVLSFTAMDIYYQVHGRDWERYAFIKARALSGDPRDGAALLAMLRPFVYRKYLDFAALESIREMKGMIEQELANHQEVARDVKRGPGGIREVEFIAQAHQLIRGGRDRRLQQRSLLRTLEQLAAMGLLGADEHAALVAGYAFLRRTENRLQMRADRQTHNLPDDPLQRLALADSMGFANWDDFHADLQRHTTAVHARFRALFMETASPEGTDATRRLAELWQGQLDDTAVDALLAESGYAEPEAVRLRLQSLRNGPLYRGLSNTGRNRLDRLVPVVLHECSAEDQPDRVIIRVLDLLAAVSRRSVYLSLLLDNEKVRRQLIHLSGASAWIAGWLTRYPILLDELLAGYTPESFVTDLLDAELGRQLGDLADDDLEAQMNVLREFCHARMLGVAVLAVADTLDARATGRALSAIATSCVAACLTTARRAIVANHGTPPDCNADDLPFCIIAYGKLGSDELGFGSDLDLVFLSGDLDESARTSGPRRIYVAQYFTRLAQRFVHIMTTRTHAGQLYEVDSRLRPNGNSGPLVANLRAFERYQLEAAWTWEHQSLVRARVITGSPALARHFDTIRQAVICRQRDPLALRRDVLEMRSKMRESSDRGTTDLFDLKQGRGGIVDIEFMVQYMVLRWAHKHPSLAGTTTTIGLLDELARLALIDGVQHDVLVAAYETWLARSIRLRLDDQDALVPDAEHVELRERVGVVWNDLLASPATG